MLLPCVREMRNTRPLLQMEIPGIAIMFGCRSWILALGFGLGCCIGGGLLNSNLRGLALGRSWAWPGFGVWRNGGSGSMRIANAMWVHVHGIWHVA